MKGFVPTPESLVDHMVAKLFDGRVPCEGSRLLDPGCGTGAFIEGVLRWARLTGTRPPAIVGVESNPALLVEAASRLGSAAGVTLVQADFLQGMDAGYDYIIGNPPYVSIIGLSTAERDAYRSSFLTATGRFDLYGLFFEQSLRLLKSNGRLVFVTPEKFAYVQSARRLRQLIAQNGVREIEFLGEDTFAHLVTYPAITTIERAQPFLHTRVLLRDGVSVDARLPADGSSWLPLFSEARSTESPHVLSDAFKRISCGVATGADQVYVIRNVDLPDVLRPFAYPTIAGRDLGRDMALSTSHSMLTPYSRDGALLGEDELGALGAYLRAPENYTRLAGRTCAARKRWYAFHENPPLPDILQPKILCKDIAAAPRFIADPRGQIVPRHSVYYLTPSEPERLEELCDFLNSQEVAQFLRIHCQRAANGFIRLQSHVLKKIPLPASLVTSQLACA